MVPKMFNALIILNAVFLATTYQIESFGCMAIICSPPKICKVIDEIGLVMVFLKAFAVILF